MQVEGVNTKPNFPLGLCPPGAPGKQAFFLPSLVSGQGIEKQKKNVEGSYKSLNSLLKEKKQRPLPCFLTSGKDQGLVAAGCTFTAGVWGHRRAHDVSSF